MEHREIENQLLVDRYLLNHLSAQQANAFEQHYLSCPECLDQLELGEKMIRGLKRTSAEQIASLYPTRTPYQQLLNRHSTAIWAVAALLAFALPSGLVYRGFDRLGNELESAQEEFRRSVSRPAAEIQPHRLAETSVEPTTANDQPSRLEQERLEKNRLEQERQKRLSLESQISWTLRPQANTPVLKLDQSRSLSPEPTYRLQLREHPEWWLFIIAPPTSPQNRYRASLLHDGQEVWQDQQLRPNADGALAVSLHSSWLVAGIYTLRLETQRIIGKEQNTSSSAWRSVGTYAFSVFSSSEDAPPVGLP